MAVVIPCHNYGRFLEEALESVRGQTHRPAEIVVVDDASTDETARVAERFPGVRYLRVEHRSPHAARAAGFRATSASHLCFLDADDRLPPEYLAAALQRFDGETVGIVSSDIQDFGDSTRYRRLDFDAARIHERNTLHHACLVRRDALEISGAFDRPVPWEAHEDWILWLQLLRDGWQVAKSPVPLEQRKHSPDQRSSQHVELQRSFYERANLGAAEVSLFIPLAGRRHTWPRLRAWLQRQTWPRQQTRLVLMDTSGDPEFAADVRRWAAASDYPDVRVLAATVGSPGLADRERKAHEAAVSLAAARIYTRAAREVAGEYVWIVEDDVIPPDDACDRLLRYMGDGVVSVSGAYRSRYHAGYVAWSGARTLQGGAGVEEVSGNGFGCLLVRRSALVRAPITHRGERGYHDWEFYRWARGRGYRALLDWDCECRHLGESVPPRFVLLTTGRAGSTLLVHALDAHPAVRCLGELFNPVYGCARSADEDGAAIAERFCPPEAGQAVGFKLGVFQPEAEYPAWQSVWDWLRDRPDVRVILNTRTDAVAHYCSAAIARQTGVWKHDSPDDALLDPERRPRVRVKLDRLQERIERNRDRLDELREALAGHAVLEVTYEELCGDWRGSVARIEGHLGVERIDLPQLTLRGETRPLSEVVENWQELVDAGLVAE